MIRLGFEHHPDFSLNTFSDSTTGGDLRFFDQENRELVYEIDEWNASGESSVWVKTIEWGPESRIFARWGNDDNTTQPPSSDIWSEFEGVWHLGDILDSTVNSRNGSSSGTLSFTSSGVIGDAINFSGSESLEISGFNGIASDNSRSSSLWLKTNQSSGNLLGWGTAGNYWNLSWDGQGPLVTTGNASGIRQGSGTIADDQWYHLLVSYPGDTADLNQTRIYLNGKLIDSPGSSTSGIVSTSLAAGVRIGSNYNQTDSMNGLLDEVRLSSAVRGQAWAEYSYLNQRNSSNFLDYDLEYLVPPELPEDINVTVVTNEFMSLAIQSSPPATLYSFSNSNLPSGLSFNVSTGILSGTPTGTTGIPYSISITASNAQGSATTTVNVEFESSLSNPVISVGEILEITGRTAEIEGHLLNTGGKINQIDLYYGTTDEGEDSGSWENHLVLGSFYQGKIPYKFEDLQSGVTYYYRFRADNTSYSSWSETGTFTTLQFDQGVLRFHTGEDETGTGAGLYWDKQDGSSEQKVANANLDAQTLIAPDGSSWPLTKAVFSFSQGLFIGPNLDSVILEGVNSLSIQVEGNVTISKNLIGSKPLTSPYVAAASTLDGHDSFYENNPQKGNRVGIGILGGYSGGQGPGKGQSLGLSGAGGLSGGGGSFGGEGGPGASGPSGQIYGSGGLDLLIGGSGGGFGNFGDAGAGGGALEITASGTVNISPGCKIAMNGGSVMVNPVVGANYSGGAGSGGSIRIIAANINNQGILEAVGGAASGMDSRETGARFLTNAGGAGGGGRIALIADGSIQQGTVILNGGLANGDSSAGQTGTFVSGPKTLNLPNDLNLNSGTLLLDTSGFWTHSSGLQGRGVISNHQFLNAGKKWGYTICKFSFQNLQLGPELTVIIQGENSLLIDVDGNLTIGTNLDLNGKSGKQGIFSGSGGPGGWRSGKGLKNTELFANLHPSLDGQGPGGGRGYEIGKSTGGGSYGNSGSGGLNGGIPGIVYGDESITELVGGSGGGHAILGSGNPGGGGGAIGFSVSGDFLLESNSTISVNGGHGFSHFDGSGAGGSGGSIRIKATSIENLGKLEARGGNAVGTTSLAGAGGGGRIAFITDGSLLMGEVNASGGINQSTQNSIYRQQDLVGYWTMDEAVGSSTAVNAAGNPALDGTISGSPDRRAGVKVGLFTLMVWMTKSLFPMIRCLPWKNTLFLFGIIRKEEAIILVSLVFLEEVLGDK